MVKVKNDLTGKKFGRLTVLRQIEDYISPKGRYIAKWLCECECGNVTEVAGYQLTSNRIKSCGCLMIEKAAEIGRGRLIDLVGEKFGRLEVFERVSNFNQCVAWRCRCSCGNEVVVTSTNLKNGSTKSCGCYLSEKITQVGYDNLIDLEGKRFGRLVVLNREENDGTQPMWRCLCDCGKEVIVKGNNLRRGYTQSCGCYAKDRSSETNLIDITGNRYGHLTVISRAENISKEATWNCLCDCGNTIIVRGCNLRHDKVDCCEICSNKITSKGEQRIAEFLDSLDIQYERQKKFSSCKNKRELPFDFYISKYNIAIEYDGKQHFEPVDWGFHDEELMIANFDDLQKRDGIKNKYCEDNGIKLIRIPYTEFDNIEMILSKNLN